MEPADRVDPRSAVRLLPTDPGVYRFRDERDRVLYIGRAVNLRRRAGSYWGKLSGRPRLRRMVPQIARVEALVCASEHEAAWVERNLLEQRLPRWNRARGGQEVPVYIRIDPRPAKPRLDVVHSVLDADGVRHFGPYLGGLKVRLAASALQRVLPLAYTGNGLRGFGRDLARIRGVDPTDRDTLTATVAAVLDRQPAALDWIRAELLSRRDSASESLAFELAARLQDEAAAIEWVVAEQKAASMVPTHAEVCAWAGGSLVAFDIRDGYLRTWTHVTCAAEAATARTAATPERWTTFAVRNAALAARLAGDGDPAPDQSLVATRR
jgi:excinuclease ABC subunit C